MDRFKISFIALLAVVRFINGIWRTGDQTAGVNPQFFAESRLVLGDLTGNFIVRVSLSKR